MRSIKYNTFTDKTSASSKQFISIVESFEQAKERNETKIMAFRASKDKTMSKTADKLIDCRLHHRCNLLACSVCLRRFRLKFLKRNIKNGNSYIKGPQCIM